MSSHIKFLIYLLLLTLPLLHSCRQNTDRPNIIFIMADDHAANAISSYGSQIIQTPNIDRLAQEGIRFDNCFATNAICAPSRAVILTGKLSHANGILDNKMAFDGSQQTFPKLFKKAGYTTAMIGKWHLKSDPTGFDYWNILPGQGYYYNPDLIEMGEKKHVEGYVTDIITDLCLNWLDRRDKSKPFLLMYHHKAPHRSWMPGPDHYYTFYEDTIPEPVTLFDDYSTRSEAAREQEMTIAGHMFPAFDLKLPVNPTDSLDQQFWINRYERFTPQQRAEWNKAYVPQNEKYCGMNLQGKEKIRYYYQRYIKDYLRCIASIDDNLGRLLNYLDENDLEENTVVIYTSDQGFFLGEHGWFDKRFMYEESLRMPLLIRYPTKNRQARVNKDIIQNCDFAPTFLELAGINIPEDMQGKSFAGILQGEGSTSFRSAAYYHYYEYPGWHMVKKHYGIRTEKYKMIHFYDDIDAWELYDLEQDPHELVNHYHDTEYNAIKKQLHAQLNALIIQYADSTVR
jgi:arylsulfatase A-like enzyme